MNEERPLFLPVILGTVRKCRQSRHVARFVAEQTGSRLGVETELIDIAALPIPVDDAGEAIKDTGFSEKMQRADGLIVVSPEYNHAYSGLLKHVLDSCLKEYIHKAGGIVGVSAGPFGGSRGIQGLLPVMRELGLVTIFWDVKFSAVHKVFDTEGHLLEPAYVERYAKFLSELIWMSKVLRHGREKVALSQEASMATTRQGPGQPDHLPALRARDEPPCGEIRGVGGRERRRNGRGRDPRNPHLPGMRRCCESHCPGAGGSVLT